jgi:hypothetical protein
MKTILGLSAAEVVKGNEDGANEENRRKNAIEHNKIEWDRLGRNCIPVPRDKSRQELKEPRAFR